MTKQKAMVLSETENLAASWAKPVTPSSIECVAY